MQNRDHDQKQHQQQGGKPGQQGGQVNPGQQQQDGQHGGQQGGSAASRPRWTAERPAPRSTAVAENGVFKRHSLDTIFQENPPAWRVLHVGRTLLTKSFSFCMYVRAIVVGMPHV
ncbi:hypothetical protein [Variibacter gotjawalensis]|uniref:hypothetical protein n=1 Tax=Variibacter gotjawalensis TaxID=1333996 RepID=UPI000BBB131D|nr:hypothetical protein [Variibacter gotjawalensis]NIK48322.1 hypothetical protein [Variibacter gotjawalensis]